jgi:hypothetical protein
MMNLEKNHIFLKGFIPKMAIEIEETKVLCKAKRKEYKEEISKLKKLLGEVLNRMDNKEQQLKIA